MTNPSPRAVARFSPRALVLDMDGLMVDSEPLWYRVECAFAAKRGGDWSQKGSLDTVGRGIAHTLETMSRIFGFPIDVRRDTMEIFDSFIAHAGELALKPGCIELLDAARGRLPLAVASSSPLRLIHAVLDRFALRDRFGAIVSGEEVPRPKPAPDIFVRAAAELGVDPEGCAVFEDSLPGSTAGRAAGMFVIAVPEGVWQGRGFEAVADRIVGDLFEAREVLEF